eukprot:CAMPEP_0178919472 /NCGR_PEP_ID=MMETSP0786-20121207/14456_1 /TAXON_ID=186022 /ORGANISM="Thalassionema frauenfeldii, Strain CCMP 1798" /LENGTH=257 /DNA_ID=CAMNT_0020593407 /DNA_START=322 /DNA_END=1095 /DNA_ORIENTATION=+
MAKKLNSLREQAHRVEREEAQKKREKKKKKKEGKKNKDIKEDKENILSISEENVDDVVFDEDDEENVDDDDSLPDPSALEASMLKVVERLKEHFKSIRGAEPSPELFDRIMVNAYGDFTPLAGVAQVVVASPTLVNVTCFDPALSKDVKLAIAEALELNPQDEENGLITVPFPRVSMEVREKTVKNLRKQAETARARIRKLRRKPMAQIKAGKEGKLEGISKDDAFRISQEIDSVTESVIKQVDSVLVEKEKTVMTV